LLRASAVARELLDVRAVGERGRRHVDALAAARVDQRVAIALHALQNETLCGSAVV
jgi:hypothetical protein